MKGLLFPLQPQFWQRVATSFSFRWNRRVQLTLLFFQEEKEEQNRKGTLPWQFAGAVCILCFRSGCLLLRHCALNKRVSFLWASCCLFHCHAYYHHLKSWQLKSNLLVWVFFPPTTELPGKKLSALLVFIDRYIWEINFWNLRAGCLDSLLATINLDGRRVTVKSYTELLQPKPVYFNGFRLE